MVVLGCEGLDVVDEVGGGVVGVGEELLDGWGLDGRVLGEGLGDDYMAIRIILICTILILIINLTNFPHANLPNLFSYLLHQTLPHHPLPPHKIHQLIQLLNL